MYYIDAVLRQRMNHKQLTLTMSTLKLSVIALHALCYGFNWFTFRASLKMSSEDECLLFVNKNPVRFGKAAYCQNAGIASIILACFSIILILFICLQMYHHSKRKSAFLAVVVVQVIMTVVALILASLITAGFVNTCETVLNDVLEKIQSRLNHGSNNNDYVLNVSCRNILTDPDFYATTKRDSGYDRPYYGFWYGHDPSDVKAIRNNRSLELSAAGSWISAALHLIILFLMIGELWRNKNSAKRGESAIEMPTRTTSVH